MLARTETARTYDSGLWRTLAAEVGCAGLLIPESLGGAGASFREVAVVAEEAGRSVAPVPYLGSAVLATVALLTVLESGEAGSAAAGALLTELAAGRPHCCLAVPLPRCQASGSSRRSGSGQPRNTTLTDVPAVRFVSGVVDALPADVLIVP